MTILILGCGWVGSAFVDKMKAAGHRIYATTTREEKYQRLQDAGISPILTDFDGEIDVSAFPSQVDYLLNSIPAVKRLTTEQTLWRFKNVVNLLERIVFKKHIFLSSVGIYPDEDGVVQEGATILQSSNLALAEREMQTIFPTIIYRLGGLFGYNRVLAKYFEGKTCAIGSQPANFVHLDDVVELVRLGFAYLKDSGVYNVVTPQHPLKKEVVVASAQKYGFELPVVFQEGPGFNKIVSGDKLASVLNYSFLYPSPIDF